MFLDKNGIECLWMNFIARLGDKVDIEDGKGLSSNDYTHADKYKLENIEFGAQVNPITLPNTYPITINGVTYDGSEEKIINIEASDSEEISIEEIDRICGADIIAPDTVSGIEFALDTINGEVV